MAEQINDGGSAFPINKDMVAPHGHPGLSLRDYFAAQVIGHLVCAPARQEMTSEMDAIYAYRVADAMLNERSRHWVKV